MKPIFCSLALALLPGLAGAHPHVFIDTRVEVILDEDGLQAVRLTWVYDDFFSLLLTEDFGLDQDMDGELTPDELQQLADYVLAWPEGYAGDLIVEAGGRALPLGPRQQHELTYSEGRMAETHLRPVGAPLDGPISIKVFDPAYYPAYSTIGPVEVTGRDGCSARITRADLMAATDMVEEMLYNMPESEAEMMYPEVGESFADTITVTCAGSS